MAYITLPTFVGYSTSSGPSRSSFVRRWRRQYEDPARGGFNFYLRAANAIRAGRISGRDREVLRALVENADERTRPHYTDIANGWLRYVGRRDLRLAEVGRSRWRLGTLEVGINPHLGLRKGDGPVYVTWLYFKEEPLSRDAAQLVLWLLEQTMDDLRPGGRPLVVDVRRSKEFALSPRDRDKVRPWVRSEASAFMSLWEAAA
ncbi:hypothetical protein ACFQ05_13065 [Amycolatopsis umgeniensis]|uniref:Uncharacterized protein n=1 Tax=Amycolatopsis umgeniensis TaxID=336628 RepID=A0A841B6X3_9PSEU|nr:hypothetical protein [Amycolatopsis umgeniensis]MBB5854234.1 hypothetical protein [Amycolatopsis umgeniensis]